MSTYTRRITWPDKENDYVFRVDGKDAGRCYLNRTHMGTHWHWTLYGSSDHGDAPTLQAAQDAFKIAYEKRQGS